MKLPWKKREEQRVTERRVVRQALSVADDLGDIEFNKKRAAELAEQAKRRSG